MFAAQNIDASRIQQSLFTEALASKQVRPTAVIRQSQPLRNPTASVAKGIPMRPKISFVPSSASLKSSSHQGITMSMRAQNSIPGLQTNSFSKVITREGNNRYNATSAISSGNVAGMNSSQAIQKSSSWFGISAPRIPPTPQRSTAIMAMANSSSTIIDQYYQWGDSNKREHFGMTARSVKMQAKPADRYGKVNTPLKASNPKSKGNQENVYASDIPKDTTQDKKPLDDAKTKASKKIRAIPVPPNKQYSGIGTPKAGNMQKVQSSRLITAVKTPYTCTGRIDLNAYDKIVEFQIANGAQGIVVGGTTGEGHLMNWEEHLTLIEHSAEKWGDNLCIIGNTGSNSTREALIATKEGFRAGMHGALQINPYYGKSNEKGVLFHFDQLMDHGPSIIYNVEGRTAQDITPNQVMEIAKHPNFAGMKECAGHERIALYASEGIKCWSGNDDQAHESRFKHGGHGVISVTSNVLPAAMRRLMDYEDPELNEKIQPFMNWLFQQPNPIGLNTVFAMTGAAQPVFRAPYWPYDQDMRNDVIALLKDFEDYEICGGQPRELKDEDFTVLGDWARGVQHLRSGVDEINSSAY